LASTSGREVNAMMQMMGEEHEGHQGMMQHCMDMMNSMTSGGTMDSSSTASMGSTLPLTLILALVLAVALGYLVGAARRTRTQI
jgi:hypothetical protein